MVTDFFRKYADLSDDELLLIASDRLSLTDEANFALDAEMSHRNLTLTDVQKHERLVEQSHQRETKRRNRKRRRYAQRRLDGLVTLFWSGVLMAAVTIAYLCVPRRYQFAPHWEQAARFVMFGSVTILVISRPLWRKLRFWLALLVSSTAHAVIVHTWIVRAGTLEGKGDRDLAVLLGPVLIGVVYGTGYLVRRKFYGEDGNEERLWPRAKSQ